MHLRDRRRQDNDVKHKVGWQGACQPGCRMQIWGAPVLPSHDNVSICALKGKGTDTHGQPMLLWHLMERLRSILLGHVSMQHGLAGLPRPGLQA